jgi:hypothetical protein
MVSEWIACSLSRPVIRRAFLSAVIVGSILVIINHGDALLNQQIDAARLFRICLTVVVPYIVSTVSSVSTILGLRHGKLD